MYSGLAESFWDWYHTNSLGEGVPRHEVQGACSSVLDKSKHQSILEIGCGDGMNLQHLSAEFSELYGCDISGVALNRANSRLGKVATLRKCGLASIPFIEEYFDLVLLSKTLGTIADAHYFDIFMANARSRIRQGGFLVVIDFLSVRQSARSFNTLNLGGTAVEVVNPSWSVIPFLHYTKTNMMIIFKGMEVINFGTFPLTSCNGHLNRGFVAVFRKTGGGLLCS